MPLLYVCFLTSKARLLWGLSWTSEVLSSISPSWLYCHLFRVSPCCTFSAAEDPCWALSISPWACASWPFSRNPWQTPTQTSELYSLSTPFLQLSALTNPSSFGSSEFICLLSQLTETRALLGIHFHVLCWKGASRQTLVAILAMIRHSRLVFSNFQGLQSALPTVPYLNIWSRLRFPNFKEFPIGIESLVNQS